MRPGLGLILEINLIVYSVDEFYDASPQKHWKVPREYHDAQDGILQASYSEKYSMDDAPAIDDLYRKLMKRPPQSSLLDEKGIPKRIAKRNMGALYAEIQKAFKHDVIQI